MKKWIAGLIMLTMLLSMLPMAVTAEEDAEPSIPVQKLYVGSVNALETPFGDGWSFDAAAGVLTLENCTLTESMLHTVRYEYEDGEVYEEYIDAMIYAEGDLRIRLIGENFAERVITQAPSVPTMYGTVCSAIFQTVVDGENWDYPGKLRFEGTGSLTTGFVVSSDCLDADGYMSWEDFQFSAAIGCWAVGSADLSGLRDGGSLDAYAGVQGLESPWIARAFACSPTFGDNCIVTAYRDWEGNNENEFGYNWNNNDAWRLKAETGNVLSGNGLLTLASSAPSSGDGWRWENNVLTLSEDTEVKAVDFRGSLGKAVLTLDSDVTLEAMGYTIDRGTVSAVNGSCDLEIDAGEHVLTLLGPTDTAIGMKMADLLISGGTVAVESGEYCYSIYSEGGNVTVRNAAFTVTTAPGSEGYAGELILTDFYDAEGDPIPGGDLLVENAQVSLVAGFNTYNGELAVIDSDFTVISGYQGSGCDNADMIFRNSKVTLSGPGRLLTAYYGRVIFDGCDLDLTGGESEPVIRAAYYYGSNRDNPNATDHQRYEPDLEAIRFQNMQITLPASWQIGYKENVSHGEVNGYVMLCDGAGLPATALIAVAAEPVSPVVTQPESICVAEGREALFRVEAEGEGLIYQWQYSVNGGAAWFNSTSATQGCSTDTLTVAGTMARNGFLYRCRVTDGTGKAWYSEAAELTVEKAVLNIVTQPSDAEAKLGGRARFRAEAEGEGLLYRWQYSPDGGQTWMLTDSYTTGYNTPLLTVVADARRNGLCYRCRITDALGNVFYSDAAKLDVDIPQVTAFASQPQAQTVAQGSKAVFAVDTSLDIVSIQWQYQTKPGSAWYNSTSATQGYNTNTLTVNAEAKRDGFSYRCVITDADGYVYISEAVILTVQ